MKHFTDEVWLDFVRDLLPAEEADVVRTHLDSGCATCSDLHEMWKMVREVASREPRYEADDTVVSAVRRSFGARSADSAARSESWLATLVFDSFQIAGAMAGTRAISPAARHLLYQAGPLTVDIRLDAYGDSTMTIAGQVLEAGTELNGGAQGEVSLLRGETILAQTSTNNFGEFQVTANDGPDLRIRLDINGQQPVVLTLPD